MKTCFRENTKSNISAPQSDYQVNKNILEPDIVVVSTDQNEASDDSINTIDESVNNAELNLNYFA